MKSIWSSGQARLFQQLLQRRRHSAQRKAEYIGAVHKQILIRAPVAGAVFFFNRRFCGGTAAQAACLNDDLIGAAAIGAQHERPNQFRCQIRPR